MSKVKFAIALHFHQPTGNFEDVFDKACRLCYKPFFELLSKYPKIKISVHISGSLFDYLDKAEPDLVKSIKKMVRRGQVEMIGGGYYEPILPAIPERDAAGQIKMMSEYLRKEFGVKAAGAWIPERVWEGRLVELLYNAGIRYCVLDDEHLIRSGIDKGATHGYYMTGGKKKIAVFPSSKALRYMIPFKDIRDVFDYFKEAAASGKSAIITYGDDGEKFGLWPGTQKSVFEDGWLKVFFDGLMNYKDIVETVCLSDCLKRAKPLGSVDIDNGSYEEMMEWSGGGWKNFLSRYAEAGRINRKMIETSDKVDEARRKPAKASADDIRLAERELYKGQCNCAYWHGLFGGIYLYHLRKAVYEHLIKADEIAHRAINNKSAPVITERAYDGAREIVMEDDNFSICIDPQSGGVIKELDYKPRAFNIVNTLSRTKEQYHDTMSKKLYYDRFPRHLLRDYFVSASSGIDNFIGADFVDLGGFTKGKYDYRPDKGGVTLVRHGQVSGVKIILSKNIKISSQNELEISYAIDKEGDIGADTVFAVEFNLVMPDLNSIRYYYSADGKPVGGINTKGTAPSSGNFGISDGKDEFGVMLNFSKKPDDIIYYPVETVSQSDRGLELNYQCSSILPRWHSGLKDGKTWNLSIKLGTVSQPS